MRLFFAFLILLSLLPLEAQKTTVVRDLKLQASVTQFVLPPACFAQTPESLEKAFPKGRYNPNPYFCWLDKEKTRAVMKRNPAKGVVVNLTLLKGEVPVDEVIIDFRDGKFMGCSVSVFNVGDSAQISRKGFDQRNLKIGKVLNKTMGGLPRIRTGDRNRGVLTSGYVWEQDGSVAVLDYNPEAPGGIHFIRLRVSSPEAEGIYRHIATDKPAIEIVTADLKRNVRNQGSAIFIENIPIIDQGEKDYCVVASVARILEYYGVPCDMHQLAQLAGTDNLKGTNTVKASEVVGQIDHFFNTTYNLIAVRQPDGKFYEVEGEYLGEEVSEQTLMDTITTMIPNGIPVLWSLELGKYKETPPLQKQLSGGHMRLITGYDLDKNLLYFSDSWGAEPHKKHMKLNEALQVTTGIYTLTPQK